MTLRPLLLASSKRGSGTPLLPQLIPNSSRLQDSAGKSGWLRLRSVLRLLFGLDSLQVFRQLQGQARTFLHVALHGSLVPAEGLPPRGIAEVAGLDIQQQIHLPWTKSVAIH